MVQTRKRTRVGPDPAPPLLLLGDDEFWLLAYFISSPLDPHSALELSCTCRAVRDALQAPLAALRQQHKEAAALCATWDTKCSDLARAEELHLTKKELTIEQCRVLGMLCSTNSMPSLEELRLSRNLFGDEGLRMLLGGLAAGAMPSLTTLRLSGNGLGPAGVATLAATLGRGALPSLKSLSLRSNKLGDEGLAALVAPGVLPALTSLSLEANAIGDRGVEALLAHLQLPGQGVLATLETLNLSGNPLSDAGCAALAVLRAGVLQRCYCPDCPFAHAINTKLLKCAGCRRALYCGRECQRADWKMHKKICKRKDRARQWIEAPPQPAEAEQPQQPQQPHEQLQGVQQV